MPASVMEGLWPGRDNTPKGRGGPTRRVVSFALGRASGRDGHWGGRASIREERCGGAPTGKRHHAGVKGWPD